MKKLLGILTLAVLLPASAMAGEVRAHIDAGTVKWVAAFNAGDGAAVAALYSEDAVLLPPGGERVDGRAAIQTFWQGAIDSGLKAEFLHAVEVEARASPMRPSPKMLENLANKNPRKKTSSPMAAPIQTPKNMSRRKPESVSGC